jgi:two-component system, NtrC family, response regulator HydG
VSGYASYCLGKTIYFSEIGCQGTEASNCVLIGKDIDTWAGGFDKDLQYFLAADIQKRVQQLSHRIREQQRALVLHRKQLQAVRKSGVLFGVEIRSKAFRNVFDLADRVAAFDTTILITGETGTGKEVLARHIHAISPRRDHPFLAVNCSALPDSLLENELFGHKAGAFTGAQRSEIGLFEAARGGTIFLDEIGDVSISTQTKLLRVLQSKEIRPVGETHSQLIDVRVISATNRDLDKLVADGRFREDLLYRLRVLHITVPPLRARTEDILPLARFFLDRLRLKYKLKNLQLAAEAMDTLLHYAWPGNVRELENALEHAAVLGNDGIITSDFLPGVVSGRAIARDSGKDPQSLAQVEMQHIQSVLEVTGGNRKQAAKLLKISESTLFRRLRERAA